MGLITKKQIKTIRLYILSPWLEYWLLFMYIVSFAVLVYIKTGVMDGTGLRQDSVKISSN